MAFKLPILIGLVFTSQNAVEAVSITGKQEGKLRVYIRSWLIMCFKNGKITNTAEAKRLMLNRYTITVIQTFGDGRTHS